MDIRIQCYSFFIQLHADNLKLSSFFACSHQFAQGVIWSYEDCFLSDAAKTALKCRCCFALKLRLSKEARLLDLLISMFLSRYMLERGLHINGMNKPKSTSLWPQTISCLLSSETVSYHHHLLVAK